VTNDSQKITATNDT